VDVEIDDEEAQKTWDEIAERNDFNEIIYNMSVDQSVYGYGNMRMMKNEDGEIVLQQIPYEYFEPKLEGVFIGEDPSVIRIISKQTQLPTTASQTAKIQSYTELTDGTRLIEY
jgi:hypothetical protein